MSVAVAVTDSPEGRTALESAVAEARALKTGLLLVNLTLHDFADEEIPRDLEVTLINRSGRRDRDPVTAVLDELADHAEVDRLVLGVRSRSRVGKVLLGSVTQRLILRSPVPVLTVRVPESAKRG
ncbi:universal stress protein [Brevibacterium sp. GP-SGM9]|uniref:universal stress protein n=1 Tax=unclassified Brevibacterium TaxID=2614124 RepID=UPI001E362AF5|nr:MULTISPECIES: universal stress protein [unclassified Brevibacterium]MCD1287428.1 universal stress protein [Brevibacterium sp. CCUG 69071]MDK8436774.1 universal stress protein [Brevibacterium sp. H-BE7]